MDILKSLFFKAIMTVNLMSPYLLGTLKASACTDIDGLSLFGESARFSIDSGYKYTGPETKSKRKFESNTIFKNKSLSFEKCRDSIWVFEIISLKTQIHYKALVTYDDGCDGGNSQGVLLDQSFSQVKGSIEDTEINCRSIPFTFAIPSFSTHSQACDLQ